jgi:hypothetical protein
MKYACQQQRQQQQDEFLFDLFGGKMVPLPLTSD